MSKLSCIVLPPREFTSARVALALLRRGIANVFVLDGGLNAWKAEGYPVTTALSSSTESHAKLGLGSLSLAVQKVISQNES
jgi:3-mercaptopyruvate sulfurtransferase SseA